MKSVYSAYRSRAATACYLLVTVGQSHRKETQQYGQRDNDTNSTVSKRHHQRFSYTHTLKCFTNCTVPCSFFQNLRWPSALAVTTKSELGVTHTLVSLSRCM
jgi:hypothetical protein